MLLCYSDDAPVVSAASCGAGSLTGVGHERTWRGHPQACGTLRIVRVVKLHQTSEGAGLEQRRGVCSACTALCVQLWGERAVEGWLWRGAHVSIFDAGGEGQGTNCGRGLHRHDRGTQRQVSNDREEENAPAVCRSCLDGALCSMVVREALGPKRTDEYVERNAQREWWVGRSPRDGVPQSTFKTETVN